MKKWIATALAAGALTAGSAAMAQDLGSILGSIFGSTSTPAVVAGSTTVYQDSYGRRFYYDQYGRQVYMQDTQQTQQIVGYDSYGRPIYGQSQQQILGYDSYGRPIYSQQQQQQIVGYDSYGRPIYNQSQQQQIVGYDSYGRPIYGTPRAYVYGSGSGSYGSYASNDRDGDGVVNWQDRWPDDRRYR